MIEQVEKWKRECKPDAFANLLPNDEELSSIWASYTAEEVKWHQFGVETAARPMLLAAAFYRTVSDPDKVQVSWRSWYLNPLDEKGQMRSWLPEAVMEYGPDELCTDPFRLSMFHAEYEAENTDDKPENPYIVVKKVSA